MNALPTSNASLAREASQSPLSREDVDVDAIVIGAGILIILRERRLGIERKAAKTATPPQ